MVVRTEKLELALLAAALAAAFFYFPLRAVFFDVFAWIIVVPIAAGLYLLTVRRRYSQFKFFGLAFIGLVVVYGSDLHYPSSMDHGPFELFLMMAGALSSLHEIARPAKVQSQAVIEPAQGLALEQRSAIRPSEAD